MQSSTSEIEHRCPTSGKVERLNATWLEMAKEHTGYCDRCHARIYANREGEETDRIQMDPQ